MGAFDLQLKKKNNAPCCCSRLFQLMERALYPVLAERERDRDRDRQEALAVAEQASVDDYDDGLDSAVPVTDTDQSAQTRDSDREQVLSSVVSELLGSLSNPRDQRDDGRQDSASAEDLQSPDEYVDEESGFSGDENDLQTNYDSTFLRATVCFPDEVYVSLLDILRDSEL